MKLIRLARALFLWALLLPSGAWAAAFATPVFLQEDVNFTSSTTLDFTSASPTSGDLIVVAGSWRGASGQTISSITSGYTISGSWTILSTGAVGATGTNTFIAYAKYSSGSGTTTVTFSASVNASRGWLVRVPAGFDTTTPVIQTDVATTASPASSTYTDTFGSAPASDSVLITAASSFSLLSTVSAYTGFTELQQETSGNMPSNVQWAAGSVGSTYGAIFGGTATEAQAIAGIEIQAASSSLACSFDDSSPVPGATVAITCSGGDASNIASVTSPDGTVKNVEAGASATSASWINWALSDFVSGGSAQNVEWNLSGTWTVTNVGTQTASVTAQVDPPETAGPDYWFGTLTGVAGDSVCPGAATSGDEYFVDEVTGTITSVNTLCSVSASTASFETNTRIWDESANSGNGQWSAVTNVVFDGDPPAVSTATIPAAGTSVSIVFDEAVSIGAGGSGGISLNFSGGASTGTYSSGAGTTTLVYTLSRTVEAGESGTLEYTQPGNGLEDSVGNDVVTFSGQAVTNNSTADSAIPIFSSAATNSAGTTVTVNFSEPVTQGAGWSVGDLTATGTEGAITFTYSSGNTTAAHVFTASRTIGYHETLTLDWAGTTDGLEDGSGNDVAAFSDEIISNNSTADIIIPTLSSATISSSGTSLVLVYSEDISVGAGGNGGHTIASCSGGAATVSFGSQSASDALTYTFSRTIGSHETGCTVAYTQPGNGVEDAGGNDVATYGATAITNGSFADTIVPTLLSARIVAGNVLKWTPSEPLTVGAGGSGGATLTSCSGGAVTATYVSAGGEVTFSLSRTVAATETGCVAGYTQPGNGFEDAAGNDLATFSGAAVTFANACYELVNEPYLAVTRDTVRELYCTNH